MHAPSLRTGFAILALATSAAVAPAAAGPVFTSAISATPTLIGTVNIGQTYTVTASGIASLCSVCNNGGALSFTADGRLPVAPTGAYAAFGTTGLDHDPTGSSYPGTGGYGQGGAGELLGSLLGSFTGAPTGPASFFAIGLGTTFTATMNETLYAVVNDTNYVDNIASSGYSVMLTQVPEPATLALFGAALFGLGLIRTRSKMAT